MQPSEELHYAHRLAPESEKSGVDTLGRLLRDLSAFETDFEDAILLFEHASGELNRLSEISRHLMESRDSSWSPDFFDKQDAYFKKQREIMGQQRPFASWINIAGRDGSLTLYHFHKTIQAIQENVGRNTLCPSIASLVDQGQLRTARKLFEASFKNFDDLRHATGHRGEIGKTDAERLRHATDDAVDIPGMIKSTGKSLTLAPGMYGSQYTATFEGRVLQYDLSRMSLAVISSVRKKCVDVFIPIDQHFYGEHQRRLFGTR